MNFDNEEPPMKLRSGFYKDPTGRKFRVFDQGDEVVTVSVDTFNCREYGQAYDRPDFRQLFPTGVKSECPLSIGGVYTEGAFEKMFKRVK